MKILTTLLLLLICLLCGGGYFWYSEIYIPEKEAKERAAEKRAAEKRAAAERNRWPKYGATAWIKYNGKLPCRTRIVSYNSYEIELQFLGRCSGPFVTFYEGDTSSFNRDNVYQYEP